MSPAAETLGFRRALVLTLRFKLVQMRRKMLSFQVWVVEAVRGGHGALLTMRREENFSQRLTKRVLWGK